jgi:hypothetical protein
MPQIKCVIIGQQGQEGGYTRDIPIDKFLAAYGAKYGPVIDSSTTPPTERPRSTQEIIDAWSRETIQAVKDYCHQYQQVQAAKDASGQIPPDPF